MTLLYQAEARLQKSSFQFDQLGTMYIEAYQLYSVEGLHIRAECLTNVELLGLCTDEIRLVADQIKTLDKTRT
jgi:hypothetical protein